MGERNPKQGTGRKKREKRKEKRELEHKDQKQGY